MANLFCLPLVSGCEQKLFRLYFSCTDGRLLLLKNSEKCFFFMLAFKSSFKIFINVFTFVYVKVNSKEIGEEILFPSFFGKMLMSAFLLRFKANYLAKCVATPIFLFGFQ